METLGNEALGKIMNIIDEAELQGALHFAKSGNNPQTSILTILNKTRVGV